MSSSNDYACKGYSWWHLLVCPTFLGICLFTWLALGVWMGVWLLHRTRTARMSPGVWVIRWGWWNPRSRSGTEKVWAPQGRFWRRSSPDEISRVALVAPGGRSSWDTLSRKRSWLRCGRFSCEHSGCSIPWTPGRNLPQSTGRIVKFAHLLKFSVLHIPYYIVQAIGHCPIINCCFFPYFEDFFSSIFFHR